MRFIRLFDYIFRPLILTDGNVELETKFHQNRVTAQKDVDKKIIDSILHDMSILDAKSTALLTHISVIIAALVFSLGQVENGFVKALIACEILAYVIVALFNLRCLNIMGPPHMASFVNSEDYLKGLTEEVLFRRTFYVNCLRIMVVLTACLPFLIVFEFVYDIRR